MASFDINKLSTPDKIIFGGGIVFLISMFLPWYGFDAGNEFAAVHISDKGTTYFLSGWLPLLLILLVCARVAITRFAPDTKLPDLPIPWSQATLGAAGAAAVILLLRVAITSDKIGGFHVSGASLDRKYGVFIALLAAVAVAVGAFMKYQAKEDEGAAPSSGPPTSF